MFGTCVIGDMNNPTTGPSSLPATLHINASECPRPAWQHCCHRVFTCQILMNMHCVLCFLSRAWPSPFTPPSPTPPFLPCAWCTPSLPTQHHLTHLPVSPHPPPHRHWHRCMCCCMACGPPDASPGTGLPHPRTTRALWAQRSSRPAWSAWASISPTMHRYLIVAPPPERCEKFNWFLFFCTFPPLYFYPPLFSLYSPSIPTFTLHPSCRNALRDFPPLATSTLWIVAAFFLNSSLGSSFSLPITFLHYPCHSTILLVSFAHRWPCRRDQESWMRKTSKPALSPLVTTW